MAAEPGPGRSGARMGSCVRWNLVSIAVGIVAILLAAPALPVAWQLGLVGLAALFLLLSVDLPGRLFRAAGGLWIGHQGKLERRRRSRETRDALSRADAALSRLISDHRAESGKSFWSRRRPAAIAEYERSHKAATVVAIGSAVRGGAEDDGILALAEEPQTVEDLGILLAGIRRMEREMEAAGRFR